MQYLCENCETHHRTQDDWNAHLLSKEHQTKLRSTVMQKWFRTNGIFLVNILNGKTSEDVLNMFVSFGVPIYNFYIHPARKHFILQYETRALVHRILKAYRKSEFCDWKLKVVSLEVLSNWEEWQKVFCKPKITKMAKKGSKSKTIKASKGPEKPENATTTRRKREKPDHEDEEAEDEVMEVARITNKRESEEQIPVLDEPKQRPAPKLQKLARRYHTLDNQLRDFCGRQRLTWSNVRLVDKVIAHLTMVLEKQFPNCSVKSFGSFKTRIPDAGTTTLYLHVSGLDGFRTAKDRRLCLKKILQENLSHSIKDGTFRKRKVVLFYTMGRTVVLTLDDRLVRPAQIISMIQEGNPYLRPLFLVIWRWINHYNLRQNGRFRISNYVFELFVFTFLHEKKILPPFCTKKNCHKDRHHLNDGLLCVNLISTRLSRKLLQQSYQASGLDNNIVSVQGMNLTSLKLACEFFHMFGIADMKGTFIGREQRFIKVTRNGILQDSYVPTTNDRFVMLDPFTPQVNVAKNLSPEWIRKFQTECRNMSVRLKMALENPGNASLALTLYGHY